MVVGIRLMESGLIDSDILGRRGDDVIGRPHGSLESVFHTCEPMAQGNGRIQR